MSSAPSPASSYNSPAMNSLYYGDDLAVLREHVRDASVDLVYLDPPFKSDQDCNVLLRSTGPRPQRSRNWSAGPADPATATSSCVVQWHLLIPSAGYPPDSVANLR